MEYLIGQVLRVLAKTVLEVYMYIPTCTDYILLKYRGKGVVVSILYN